MSEYQIVDLFLNISTKQDALWAIFFSVHMAIFGGIIYVDRPLKRNEKVFAVAAYLVFAMMNFVSVSAGQRMMGALRSDLANIVADDTVMSETALLFETASRIEPYQQSITMGVHVLAALMAIGAIVFDRERKPKETPRRSA